jgi:hypothetical protein
MTIECYESKCKYHCKEGPFCDEEECKMIKVAICNDCGKPFYGRKNVEDRCVCDIFGNFHYEEIDTEI